MRCCRPGIVSLWIVAVIPLGAQTVPDGVATQPGAVPSAASTPPPQANANGSLASVPPPLPATLTPPAAPKRLFATVRANDGPGPYLFGFLGGIVGLFAGAWLIPRGCEERCEEEKMLGGMIGAILGALLGYRLAGGDIGDIDGPPPTRPWP